MPAMILVTVLDFGRVFAVQNTLLFLGPQSFEYQT
jgi:hypothetical protein